MTETELESWQACCDNWRKMYLASKASETILEQALLDGMRAEGLSERACITALSAAVKARLAVYEEKEA